MENPTSETILNLLKVGMILTTAFIFPKSVKGVKEILYPTKNHNSWKKYNQNRLRQIVKRLIDRKLISIKKEGDESVITLSEEGRKEILKFNLEKFKISRPKKWDNKWHVVIFDVNEAKRSLRDTLRWKMKTLGFFPLQKSVFIHPYPCEKEIAFLRQIYNIGNEVSVFTATNLEEEDYLKKHFNLA